MTKKCPIIDDANRRRGDIIGVDERRFRGANYEIRLLVRNQSSSEVEVWLIPDHGVDLIIEVAG